MCARWLEWCARLADARLDELLPKRRFDLTQDYGGIVAASMVCHLLDMPLARASEVLGLVNSLSQTDPDKGGTDVAATVGRCVDMLIEYVAMRRAAGADGSVPLIDGLLALGYYGRPLSDAEVATQLVCAFVGGTETVPKIAAHGLMELNDRPEQMAAVRADLAVNVPVAVEEMIRFCAPAQWFARTAHKDVQVAGADIRKGQRIIVLFGSAARDEAEFETPRRVPVGPQDRPRAVIRHRPALLHRHPSRAAGIADPGGGFPAAGFRLFVRHGEGGALAVELPVGLEQPSRRHPRGRLTMRKFGPHIRRVVDARNHTGETPVWCAAERALYWIDCHGPPRIQRWDAVTGEIAQWDMPERCGGIVLKQGGGAFVTLASGLFDFDFASGELIRRVASPLPDHVALHECALDPAGRFWVGAIDSRVGPGNMHPGGAKLFRLDGGNAHPGDRGHLLRQRPRLQPRRAHALHVRFHHPALRPL